MKSLWFAGVGLLVLPLSLFADGGQAVPRPEYPRPQMVRSEWLNLNGTWQFAETDDNRAVFMAAEDFPDQITVPFCRESELSGLKRTDLVKNVWYRRTFHVPESWTSPRVRLHIGACDWRTTVWVNGRRVGGHIGGSVAFGFDVTDFLQDGGNTVVIHAFDDTPSKLQPCGKQSQEPIPHGMIYTRTTGIWQTVWLEGVGSSFIRQISVNPDPAGERALLGVEVDGLSRGLEILAVVRDGAAEVCRERVAADWRNGQLVLPIPDPKLWQMDDPFLYDLTLQLKRGEDIVDEVSSYFGMRTVSIEGRAVLINGKPVFQRQVLDQGFYPDGIWTAPSDEALRRDIELSLAAGFNSARLHQKVFEPRFLYWADRMGYLVWGEFPNWGLDYQHLDASLNLLNEWTEILARDRNHPSIIGWCPFNETLETSTEIQRSVLRVTRLCDPGRPVIDSSGWWHAAAFPDLRDAHDYNRDVESFESEWDDCLSMVLPDVYNHREILRDVPFFISEYGGKHLTLYPNWSREQKDAALNEFYGIFEGLAAAQLNNPSLFGFCYTQLTDVETERNGVYTYDREPKFDMDRLKKSLQRPAAYESEPPYQSISAVSWTPLVAARPEPAGRMPWKYRVAKDAPQNWNAAGFDDSSWASGMAMFGHRGGFDDLIESEWKGQADMWMRQEFDYDGAAFDRAALVLLNGGQADVYINGEPLKMNVPWKFLYRGSDVADRLRSLLKQGRNVMAVHVAGNPGKAFIDAGILIERN